MLYFEKVRCTMKDKFPHYYYDRYCEVKDEVKGIITKYKSKFAKLKTNFLFRKKNQHL